MAEAFAAPSALGGAWASVGWRFADRAPVEAAIAWFAPQDSTLAGSPRQGATFARFSAIARACDELRLGAALRIAPCVGAGVDVIVARGFGADVPLNATAAVPVASLGLRGVVPIATWLSLRADAESYAPFSRPTFQIVGGGSVYQDGPVWCRLSAGTEVSF